MIESTLSNATESMHGVLHGADQTFRGVSTDSRSVKAGELFVALQGPNFDGAAFVEAASSKRAAGAVVNSNTPANIPCITVDDTRIALGRLAGTWRQEMHATVVGITGSNGKTTLKEFVSSCLSQSAKTLATQGNLNNEIGMPLMLLRLQPEHRYAVIEMGANHAGEIAYLSNLAAPEIVAITNAGPAHLEGFGSIEGVAKAKGEILQSDVRPQAAILNADDRYFDYWKSLCPTSSIVSFGLSSAADVFASDIQLNRDSSDFRLLCPQGNVSVSLPMPGRHNVRNACAAAAIACALDIPLDQIRSGLESVQPVSGRLKPLLGIRGARIYDDSYNANPASVIAATEFLAEQEGESVLVLADMGELGADSAALHRSVGVAAKSAKVGRLMATGDSSRATVDAFGDGGSWYASTELLIDNLLPVLTDRCNVLVKGSRSMRMERVVDAIRSHSGEGC